MLISIAAYSGGAWLFGLGSLILPAMAGAPPDLLVIIGVLVVGMQAAQTIVVQVGSTILREARPLRIGLKSLAILLAVVAIIAPDPSSPAEWVALGAIAGLVSGTQALELLLSGHRIQYQRVIFLRTALLFAGAILAALASAVSDVAPRIVLVAVPLIITLRAHHGLAPILRNVLPELGTSAVALRWTVGLGASLYYRNDVNWIRAAAITSPDFYLWHYSLAVYAAVQALLGLLIVHFMYSNRIRWRAILVGTRMRLLIALAIAWMVVWVGLLSFTVRRLDAVVVVALATFLSPVVIVTSGFCHLAGTNFVPYFAGVAGVTALLMIVAAGDSISTAFLAEIAIVGSVNCLGMFYARWRLGATSR